MRRIWCGWRELLRSTGDERGLRLSHRGAVSFKWLFSERREENPSGNHSGAATVVCHRSTGTRSSGAVSRSGLGERLELILPGSGLLKPNGCPIWLHYGGGNRGNYRST